jgi:hypothetical protein
METEGGWESVQKEPKELNSSLVTSKVAFLMRCISFILNK